MSGLLGSKDVIIIGGGKSIREGLGKNLWEKIKTKEVWSLNYAFLTMPYLPKKQLFVDISFYKEMKNNLLDLHDKGVELLCRHQGVIFNDNFPVKMYQIEKREHLSTLELIERNTRYATGLTLSGAFALSCAICERCYDRIFLLGFDFGTPVPTDTDTHYYQGSLKCGSRGMGNITVYRDKENLKEYVNDWEYFKDKHYGIYNVSMLSNINTFPKITYDNFFEML